MLCANTTGTANAAMGEALEYNTTGSYNTGWAMVPFTKTQTADAATAVEVLHCSVIRPGIRIRHLV